MMFAFDFILGLLLGAAMTALAAAALFHYREYQREISEEIERLNQRLEDVQALTAQPDVERKSYSDDY